LAVEAGVVQLLFINRAVAVLEDIEQEQIFLLLQALLMP
jgi:hypothetical protein